MGKRGMKDVLNPVAQMIASKKRSLFAVSTSASLSCEGRYSVIHDS